MSIYIIAEAGCNHCGNMDLACRMIEAATLAGADCVKFQTYQTDLLIHADDIKDFCRRCELGPSDLRRLMGCCAANGVDFLSSAFDIPSLELLAELGVNKLKIPSGQIHNKDYMKLAGQLFICDRIFMSTGMSGDWEVNQAFGEVWGGVIMHCTTAYPVPLDQACMRMMRHYGHGRRVGFSDHTMADNIAAIMAVALRACAIEHHFYLEEVDSPDMPASFDMLRLADYIRSIRDAEIAMGQACHKFIQPCEKNWLKRRDEIRYPDKEQGLDNKANHGVSGTDISGNVPPSAEVPRNIRDIGRDCR